MKEIKFRLRQDNKIVGYERWSEICACWLYAEPDSYFWTADFIHHKQKDQYIGLKDKNGKEIYNADILESEKYKNLCVVDWVYDGWHFKVNTIKGERFYPIGESARQDPLRDQLDYFEIIGNKYSNPELIKEISHV